MHEHAFVKNLVEFFKDKPGVKKITISVGELSHHTPQGVRAVFEQHVKGTNLEGVELIINTTLNPDLVVEGYET